MSVVRIDSSAASKLGIEDLKGIAKTLNIDITEPKDAEQYLLLLQSFEAVMNHIDDAPDCIHPGLELHSTVAPRDFWKPDGESNPLNAWSHRCNLVSANSTSSLLKGRTIAIKDNISVGGLLTTLGTFDDIASKEGVPPVSPIDATVVSRLLAAGAVIKGTSTCENFCASPLSFSSATGPVHNPLLKGYTSGGSSSGSCALVASHELEKTQGNILGETVELAIGGDQAGSVRNPAAFCGLYGLKPTFGLIPYTGAVSMSPMIDHIGPIAATLEDIAALLQVMAGYDGLDARMTPETPLLSQVKEYTDILANYRRDLSSRITSTEPAMRIGLLKESFTIDGLSPEVRDGVYQSAKQHFTAAGAEVIEVSVPMHVDGPIIWTASTRPSISDWLCQGRTSGYLSHLPPHIQTQWPPTQDMYEKLTATNPALVNIMFSGELARSRYGYSLEAKAHRKVWELRAAYDKALEDVDVLVTPCAPTVAMPHPKMRDEDGKRTSVMEKVGVMAGVTNNTCPFNVTGHPALTVPCGFVPASGHPDVQLPFGMQLVGRRWQDEVVLKAAALFEQGKQSI